MKKIILGVFALMGATSFSQENGYFFGGLESNMQWLLDDEKFDFPAPEEQFRANNYLQLNYSLGKFTAGVQYESYLPVALSGYSPTWDSQNGIGTYYLNFKNETCYTFTVNDSFGDGGSRVTVTDTDGVQLYRALGNWGAQKVGQFSSNGVLSTNQSQLEGVNIYPNPARETLNISNAETASIEVYDMLGRMILSKENISVNEQLNVSGLNTGAYFVKISKEGNVATKKFIVSK